MCDCLVGSDTIISFSYCLLEHWLLGKHIFINTSNKLTKWGFIALLIYKTAVYVFLFAIMFLFDRTLYKYQCQGGKHTDNCGEKMSVFWMIKSASI